MAFQRRRHFEAILPLIWLSHIALAQDDENRILYPDAANLTFHYKDTIDVSFATNYETPWMYLYCRDSAGSRQEIIYYSPSDVKDKTVLPVQLQSNTEYTGSTCWFNLVPEQPSSSDDEIGVDSAEFNYVKEEAGSETFSLSSTSSAPTRTATSTSAAATAAITTSATAPTSTHNSGLSTGAKAGIGIAAGLVGLAVIAAVAFMFLRRGRKPKYPSVDSLSQKPEALQYAELPEYRQAEELDAGPIGKPWTKPSGTQGAYELPAYQ